VILCAGSINTPQLMLVSGLGPAAHLREHGIGVVADLRGVGQNLVDHVSATIAYELHGAPPVWARTPCESVVLWQTDPALRAPDLLFHFVLRLREKYVGLTQFDGVRHGVKISPNVARPKSRGAVTLGSSDIHDKPIIDLNYFSDSAGDDRATLIKGLHIARKLGENPALAPWFKREVAPGPMCQTDDDLFAYIRQTCETVYHPAGTCRMGATNDAGAVVTPDLRVKGVQGLRVADASVFPDMVTVNINNTVMMVAEHAVDLLLG
jgi:choline dehydrogenase-like flavoprotein